MKYTLEDSDFSRDLDVKIIYRKVIDEREGFNPNETWEFEFKTNGDELKLDTKTIELDHKFILDNGQEVTIEKYTSNSLGQKIYYRKTAGEIDYDIKLEGTDDLGNKVDILIDSSKVGNGILKKYDLTDPLFSEAKSLTLTPYVIDYPVKSEKLSENLKKVGEEFTIELN